MLFQKILGLGFFAALAAAQSCDFTPGSCSSLSCGPGASGQCVEDHGTGGGQCQCLATPSKGAAQQACDFSPGSCNGLSCPAGTPPYCVEDHGIGGGQCECLNGGGKFRRYAA